MAFSFFEDEVLPLENGNNTNQLACVMERLGSNTEMCALSGCLCKPRGIISYTEFSYVSLAFIFSKQRDTRFQARCRDASLKHDRISSLWPDSAVQRMQGQWGLYEDLSQNPEQKNKTAKTI